MKHPMNDYGLIKALETFGEGLETVRAIKAGDKIDLEVGHLTVQLADEKRAVDYWRTNCNRLAGDITRLHEVMAWVVAHWGQGLTVTEAVSAMDKILTGETT